MRILRGTRELDEPIGPFAVAIGIFDGVHRGHQVLLAKTKELAAQAGIESLVYTFHPHPASVLRPELAPRLIEPIEARLARLASLELSAALVEPFDRQFAKTTAEAFVRQILVGKLRARHVVVGENFTFGRGQEGKLELLRRLGPELGFEVHALTLERVEGIAASSTLVRQFVSNGQVRGATLILGRPFSLAGLVMRGSRRGAKLGFPTANVATHNELVPGTGVYVAQASLAGRTFAAVVNVGYVPTFESSGGIRIEAHLLGYGGEALYGQTLSLDFLERLRSERRFENAEALKKQIAQDIAEAKRFLANHDAQG